MSSKKITKIVVHYSDGTVEEVGNQLPWQKWDNPTLPWTQPDTIQFPVNNCSKCGLELKGVMGYVCSHFECPTGMGPRTC